MAVPTAAPDIRKVQLYQHLNRRREVVHNHPSGDPTPSQADIAMTREVKQAAAALGITLHDHVILGRGRHASLRTLGLL